MAKSGIAFNKAKPVRFRACLPENAFYPALLTKSRLRSRRRWGERARPHRHDRRYPEREDDGKRGASRLRCRQKVEGRERHVAVDTSGLLLGAILHAADVQESRLMARPSLSGIRPPSSGPCSWPGPACSLSSTRSPSSAGQPTAPGKSEHTNLILRCQKLGPISDTAR
jgi:hypothetical protein